MVIVVLDPPALKWVDQRHEGNRANNVLHQLVLAEGPVGGVMPNDEQLQQAKHLVRQYQRSQLTHGTLSITGEQERNREHIDCAKCNRIKEHSCLM